MPILMWQALALVLAAGPMTAAPAPSLPPGVTDWGGGYLRGADSASTTVATSGAGQNKPAPVAVPAPGTAAVPLTDWGGGYRRGGDSASTTSATAGAGAPKPNA